MQESKFRINQLVLVKNENEEIVEARVGAIFKNLADQMAMTGCSRDMYFDAKDNWEELKGDEIQYLLEQDNDNIQEASLDGEIYPESALSAKE